MLKKYPGLKNQNNFLLLKQLLVFMKNKKILAIIPARGGSMRIPNKNIKDFFGKPIISYSIKAAQKSSLFDEIMVSTDDPEIADVAKQYGASIPFMRSTKASNAHSTVVEAILEVIGEYKKKGILYEYVACVYATAPLITSGLLRQAFNKMKKNDADGILPVVRFNYPIQRALRVKKSKICMFYPEYFTTRSQDLEPAFYDAALFWIVKTQILELEKNIFTKNTALIEVSRNKTQDIDDSDDWKLAELKYRINYL